uniref:Arm DNA-binding domain-containing protein n=1 Tax=Salmonella enterica TaxID=28901 RepID=UPI00112F51EC
MALTDTAIRKIKPTEKSFKITDSSGLYLLIKPNGSKLWYMVPDSPLLIIILILF